MVVARVRIPVRGGAWDRLVSSRWVEIPLTPVRCDGTHRLAVRLACRPVPLSLALCGLPQPH